MGLTGPGNNLTARVADLSRDFARSVRAESRDSRSIHQASSNQPTTHQWIGIHWLRSMEKEGETGPREERARVQRPSVRPSSAQNLLLCLRLWPFPPVPVCPRDGIHPEKQEATRYKNSFRRNQLTDLSGNVLRRAHGVKIRYFSPAIPPFCSRMEQFRRHELRIFILV